MGVCLYTWVVVGCGCCGGGGCLGWCGFLCLVCGGVCLLWGLCRLWFGGYRRVGLRMDGWGVLVVWCGGGFGVVVVVLGGGGVGWLCVVVVWGGVGIGGGGGGGGGIDG